MKNKIVVSGLLLALLSPVVMALEVDREVMPRIQLGGRIMASIDALDLDSDPDEESNLSLSDSSLLARFDKRTYNNAVAGATIGFSDKDDVVVFHQFNGFYWNRDFAVTIGRGRLRNTLLELPLMRDDDLLDYTHVGNASSSDEFDQIFGKQLSFDLFLDQKIQRFGLWVGTRGNGASPAFSASQDSFNSAGFGYIYKQPEDLRYVKRLRHAGVIQAIEPILHNVGYWDKYMTAQNWFTVWGFWAVVVAGFSPIPFKLFTISAGAMAMSIPPFMFAALIGRSAHFFLVSFLMAWAGPKLEPVVLKYIEWLGWLTVLLIAVAIFIHQQG